MSDKCFLKGGEVVLTEDKADAWHVTSGRVIVFIVSLENGKPGTRTYLYEANASEVIPSLCFIDFEYKEWRFCLAAIDTAEMTIIKGGATDVLKTRFSQKANLAGVDVEGFDNAVVNFYKLKKAADDGLIHKIRLERTTTYENILKLIYNVFSKEQIRIKTKKVGNPLYDAVAIICDKTGIPIAPVEKVNEACPDGFTIHDIARISHFSCREIVLDENWYKSDSGVLLAFDQHDRPIACIPKGQRGYSAQLIDRDEVKPLSITAQAESITPTAYSFYRPLPNKPVGVKELYEYCIKSVNTSDVAQILSLTSVCTFIGLLIPMLNQSLYDTLIPMGASSSVIQLGFVIGSVMIGNLLFSVAKSIANFRVLSRITIDLQCAVQDRLFKLPISFYRKYESADLAIRMNGAVSVVEAVVNSVLVTGLTAVLAIAYFILMLSYSVELSSAGLLMLTVYAVALLIVSRRVSKFQAQMEETDSRASSALYQFISGIAKIRMSGAEDRALFEFMKLYTKARQLEGQQNVVSSFSGVLSIMSKGVVSVVLYWIVASNGSITIGEFIAFNSAFGFFSGAFMEVISTIAHLRVLKATYERCRPVLNEIPELDEAKELPGQLNGELEINNVSFSYSPEAPLVLDNVSLSVKAGEYVGIVGPSGCGKSTLLKLLLGFETPNTGKIYYDGKDIESLDKRELRKKLGVVLQDGKLIAGSIFENITITSPGTTLSDVEEIVRKVGFEDDINDMPMGLYTVLSEDSGTISGGQQQRILIARAIVGNPKILLFDEATSALDNVTQAIVSRSLDAMKSTRLIIAHRLSTIINCDRIIVMDSGKILEHGRFEDLMNARGLFYELASRQMT